MYVPGSRHRHTNYDEILMRTAVCFRQSCVNEDLKSSGGMLRQLWRRLFRSLAWRGCVYNSPQRGFGKWQSKTQAEHSAKLNRNV